MKKVILIAAMSIFFISRSVAQGGIAKMYLKASGFTGVDSTKSYVVLEYDKIMKGDLYKKSLTYLNGIYKTPSKVISVVEGESITVNGFDDHLSQAGNLYKFPFSYNIVLQFKDGKIKFEPRIVEMKEIFTVNNKETPFYVNSLQSPKPVEIHCIYLHNNEKNVTILFQEDIKLAIDKWINSYISGINNAMVDNW